MTSETEVQAPEPQTDTQSRRHFLQAIGGAASTGSTGEAVAVTSARIATLGSSSIIAIGLARYA